MMTWIMDVLKTRLTRIDFHGLKLEGAALVLGSAPNATLPGNLDQNCVLVSVNAAQSSLRRMGCNRLPDITIISDRMFGHKPANIASQEAVRNHATKNLVLIQKAFSLSDSVRYLNRLNYKYENIFAVDHWQRSAIVFKVLGEYLALSDGQKKISNGMFAALFAAYLGASRVILCGISPGTTGHSYNDMKHPRAHSEFDMRALSAIKRKQLPFFFAEPDNAKKTGLPVWSAS